MSKPAILEARGISKSFPGVRALHEVSFSVEKGEILALLGENGAGKSTLMKILAGVQEMDCGEIRITGATVSVSSVDEALELGIALIHQELNLATNLSVGANIFLGREATKFGLIDEAFIGGESRRFLEMVGLEVEPETLVEDLSMGRRQLVEIAKALSIDTKVLIMDEPTSSLSQNESERLFEVVKDLSRKGVSIIYISHRLGEVVELADRVVILRDGENAGEIAKSEITHDRMVSMMVGRELSQFYSHDPQEPGESILRVTGLRTSAHPECSLDFSIRSKEIVGLAGLVGAGRTNVLETLFGITPALGGTVQISGKEVELRNPMVAIQSGITLIPEDRKSQGLILDMGVDGNLSLAALRRDQKKGFRNVAAEKEIAEKMIGRMQIKTPSSDQIVRFLSGGNQQKVVIGKWLALQPRVLLLDEPTRGIDVGAKQEIYTLMEELSAQGVAILFVSSEMEEILGMSDRVMVMHEGGITGELDRDELSEEAVMQLATGNLSAQVA